VEDASRKCGVTESFYAGINKAVITCGVFRHNILPLSCFLHSHTGYTVCASGEAERRAEAKKKVRKKVARFGSQVKIER
jgi:hypothetical protein